MGDFLICIVQVLLLIFPMRILLLAWCPVMIAQTPPHSLPHSFNSLCHSATLCSENVQNFFQTPSGVWTGLSSIIFKPPCPPEKFPADTI